MQNQIFRNPKKVNIELPEIITYYLRNMKDGSNNLHHRREYCQKLQDIRDIIDDEIKTFKIIMEDMH